MIKLFLKHIFTLTVIFLLVVKCIQFVLLKYRDNWFALNHLLQVTNTMWTFLLKCIILEWANKILVSSAKIIGAEVLFIILGKSFTYKRKSRDPKTRPCGPSCLTFAQLETLLLLSLSLYIADLKHLLSYSVPDPTFPHPVPSTHLTEILDEAHECKSRPNLAVTHFAWKFSTASSNTFLQTAAW